MLRSWRHSGFQVYAAPRILPREEEATEKLVRYIIRAFFSWERMTYSPEESKVVKRIQGWQRGEGLLGFKVLVTMYPMYEARKSRWRVERFQYL